MKVLEKSSRTSRTRTVFEHPNSLRIFGPAGAGKTQAGVDILREHVEDGDFGVAEGIICSFTRIAARDIARRVKGSDEQSRYHCTLHALAKRYYGFDSEVAETRIQEFFEGENIAYKRGRVGDGEEWMSSEADSSTEGALLVAFWSRCRNLMISLSDGRQAFAPVKGIEHWWNAGTMDRLFARYQAWKQSEGLIDFTDMLETVLLNPPEGADWPFFLLDEAQDSTPLQWAVANAFARQCEVAYVLGDDDQAIYQWAGARPEEFIGAGVAAQDTLHVNHRCRSRILDEAQAFIRRNKVRHDKAMVAAYEGGEVADKHVLPELDVGESTFVMARAYYLLIPVMNELERMGYPFVDRRGSKGINGKAALQFGRFMRLASGERVSVDEWRLLCEVIPSSGPWLVRGAKTRLRELDTTFRTATSVGLRGLLDYGATEAFLDAVQSGSLDPLARMSQDRLGYLREVRKRHGDEYLDERAVARVCQVGPVHAFKGLECDHAILHSGMPPTATREAWTNPEPERRVFYVGMTRAKHKLTHLQAPAFAQWKEVL